MYVTCIGLVFDLYIILSPLPMKVHAMLLCRSISKMALESQLEKNIISTIWCLWQLTVVLSVH